MSTPATPPVAAATDILTKLANGIDIKFNVTGQLPGEAMATALIQYATAVRASMDPALAKRLDAITVQQAEDLQKIWRGIWVATGILQ